MKNQWERFQEIIKAWKSSRTRKRVAMTLSGFIVFATVYMLILPAITLEKEEADNMAGISVDSTLDAGDEIYMEDEADDPSEAAMEDEGWAAEEGVIMDDLSGSGPAEDGITDDPSAAPAENEGWTAEEGASLDDLSAFDLIEDDMGDSFDDFDPYGPASESVFKEKTDNGLVTVKADPGVLPSDTSMKVKEVHDEKILEAVTDAVEEAYLQENLQISPEISHIYAVDFRFLDEGKKEVQPLDAVRMTLTAKRPVEDDETVMVIRIDEKGHAEMIEEVWTEPYKPDGEDDFVEPGMADTVDVTDGTRLNVKFEAEEASVYAAVYLVETWQDAYVEDFGEESEADSAAAEDDIAVAAEDNAEAETVNVPEEDISDVPVLDEFTNVTTNGAGAETVTEEVERNASQTLTEAFMEPATEEFPEAITERQTETATEKLTEATTEKQTETASEELTEVITEEQTEPATEDLTEATTEEQTEPATEEQLTEVTTEEQTEPATEELTEAITEGQTEPATEELTEATTEEQTEPATEEITEALTEEQTETATEELTEAITEKETEAATEALTEEVTEEETEAVTEELTETATEEETEAATEELTETTTEEQTEAATEELTEAITEEQTEAATEELTEEMTEEETEAATEELTEETTEEETEAATEELTEETTEEETEAVTEELTEAETEKETETEEEKYPAQQFAGTSIGGIMVRVTADEGAFPEGTRMVVEDVEEEQILPAIEDAAGQTQQVVKVHAVNITFYDKEENEIEPRIPVNVVMRAERSAENENVLVMHVDDEGAAQTVDDARIVEVGSRVTATVTENVVDSAEAEMEAFDPGPISEEEVAAQAGIPDEESLPGDELQAAETIGEDTDEVPADESEEIVFGAEGFSVYAIVYTVDFHWEVDGRMYEFSLPGGGFISFSDLIEVLGVAKTGENDDVYLPGEVPGIDNKDENGENNTQENAESAENTGYSGVHNSMEVSGIENQDAMGESNGTALTLDGVVVSEKTREFVADVESVVFSSPELMDVSKVESETTVGGIKESRGLEVQYSAELTEEQIAEINSTVVESGDWALISMLPFESTESLTVTMNTGEVFEIRVTDYQLSTNVLTADGQTYRITVTYDDDAEIPVGTKLVASEIEPGTDEYLQHLGRAWAEVNKEYFEVEEMRENYDETMGELPEVRYTNINTARFFDISLIYNGEEIEPKAPVQVEISYEQGLEAWEETTPGVAHYVSEAQVEIIEDIETTIQDNEVTRFRYEQESFSGVGTYVGQEIQDNYVESKLAAAPDPNRSGNVRAAELTEDALDEVVRSSLKSTELLRAGETEQSDENDNTGIEKPEAHKSLTKNKDEDDQEDGTYTLTLSVKGHSSVTTETTVKKSNVLIVMDRSSSMITKTVSDESTRWYYGTKATSSWRGDLTEGNGYHFIGIVDGQDVDLNVSYDWWNGGSWDNPSITYTSGGNTYTYPDDAPIYVESKKTRMTAEQEALSTLFTQLMENNDASGVNNDVVEISVISFGDERFDDKSWSNETEIGWQTGRDTSALMSVVNSNRFTSGTNWEEALQYAYYVISAKKNAEIAAGNTNEDYYVIFLTDGEPTAVEGESGGAYHTTDPNTGSITNGQGNIYAYEQSKDDAKALVDAGFAFYNIFTFRTTEDEKYSIYLTNYAYGNGNQNGDTTTEAVQNYFEDAQTIDSLTNKFNDIFNTIEDSIGHGNVSITDTMTTDAMTTTVVQGKTNGYVYTVTDPQGNTLYTVTATGDLDNPTVTFNVPGSTTENYTAQSTTVGGKTVYYVTTDEGKAYKMALADINDATGQLVWDLAPVGLLLDGCTYSVNFIVWPDQDAYDYVAALNNGLTSITDSQGNTITVEWDDDAAVDSGKGYFKGGVAAYPSIVKYRDGTFAVLTNTDQQLHYSVIETKTENGTTSTEITGPFYHDLELPDPMPLEKIESNIEKQWNVERDPGILAQLLYDRDGNSTEYGIDFKILKDDDGSTDEDDDENTYTTVHLGWDASANNGEGAYLWDPDSERHVTYNGHDCVVGTRWATNFSIATGLMLSTERMEALGLDTDAYPSGVFEGTTYYILEEGHDFTIQEPGLTYEFDFDGPTYHPMLVDGVMRSVDVAYTKDDDGHITAVNITGMSDADVDLSSLKIQNTLRGYINLDKIVVKPDGTTPAPDDQSKFTYNIILENDTDPGPFTIEGSHVPWYGISGLFYHTIGDDGQYHYFQARPDGENRVKLTDEDGNTLYGSSSDFVEDVGPAHITLDDDTELLLYGNQMDHASDNYVSATIQINQNQTLNIANVPAGTQYTITEAGKAGYEFVRILKEIKVNPESEAESSETLTDSSTITGTIVANRDNHITYTNKQLITSIDVEKVWKDSDGNTVSGNGLSAYLDDDAYIDVTLKRYKMVEKSGTLTLIQNLTDSTDGQNFDATKFTVGYTLTDDSNVVVYAGTYTGTNGAVISGLKLGKTYTLTINNSADGFNVDPTGDTRTVTMSGESAEETLSAEITDIPPEYGSIVIRQTVTGTAVPAGNDTWVTNYVVKQNGTEVATGSYSGVVNYEVTNLPVGDGYSVEITNSTTNSNYTVGTTTTQEVSGLTVTKDTQTPAAFINTFNKKVGSITINQTLNGSGASEGASSYTVNYTVEKGTETVATGSYTGTAGATINNLEIGNDYKIVLSCSGGSYEGEEFVATQEYTDVSVTEGGNTPLNFTNTLTQTYHYGTFLIRDYYDYTVTYQAGAVQYAPGTVINATARFTNGYWPSRDFAVIYNGNTVSHTYVTNTSNGNNYIEYSFSFTVVDSGDLIINVNCNRDSTQLISFNMTEANRSRAANSSLRSSSPTLRSATTRSISLRDAEPNDETTTTVNTTQDLTVSNDGTAPTMEYYTLAIDTSFNDTGSMTIRLPDNGNWKKTVDNLAKTDENGNPYVYFIEKVEEHNVPSGTVASIDKDGTTMQVVYGDHDEDGAINDNDTLGVTDTLPDQVGNLKITKELLGDLEDTEDTSILNKQYKVTIQNSEGKYLKSDGSFSDTEVELTVSASTPLEFTNIPVGTYTVTEKTDDGVAIEGFLYNVEESATNGTGNVTFLQTATVELKNYYDKLGGLKLKKLVTINDFDPAHSAVTDKTVADGTYTFNIVGSEGTATAGKSYTVKIIITNGTAASATIKDNTEDNPTDVSVTLTDDGQVEIPNLPLGTYTVTEDEDNKTVCIAVNSTGTSDEGDPENRKVTVVLDGADNTVDLVTFINNYADNSETDIAHVSVRKTFEGISSASDIPEGFNITAKVTATIDGTQKEFNYTLTGQSDTTNGVIWNQSTDEDGNIVWDWKISIKGLNPDAVVVIEEHNYEKSGYDVITSVNPNNEGGGSTSYTGTVSPSTTVQSIATVITEQNSLVFPLEDIGTEQTIFIARIVPSQTSLVISKNKLNLSERAALEAELHHMPNAQDWYNGATPLYYSFEEAANNQIVVRNQSTVTYYEEGGKGYIRFSKKAQWNMVASRKIIYVDGRPADFNFVNSYTERGTGIDIVKVDKNQRTTKLPGAVFTLTKLDELTKPGHIVYKKVTVEDEETHETEEIFEKQVVSEATGNDGKTSFSELPGGYYEIKETHLPDGYVLTGDGCIYVKIADGVATYLAVSEDENKTIIDWEPITATQSTDLVQVTLGRADDPTTTGADEDETINTEFSIGNTPGAALPNTGGPGTNLIYLLGLLLTSFAGTGILMKRRRRNAA